MKIIKKSIIHKLSIFCGITGLATISQAQTLELKRTMSAAKSGVVAATFSSKGDELLTGDSSGSLQIWNTSKGTLIKSFQTNIGNFRSVAWSKDSSIIVGAGCSTQEYVQDIAQIWARGKGTWLSSLTTSKKPTQGTCTESVAFSPDGHILACGMSIHEGNTDGVPSRGRVVLWSSATGKAIKSLEEAGDVQQIAFSTDGKTLVCGSNKVLSYRSDDTAQWRSTISLWDVGAGKRIKAESRADTFINSVAFSPDGKTVALACELFGKGGGRTGGEVKLWDIQSGKIKAKFASSSTSIDSLSFSPNGKWIVTSNDVIKFGEVIASIVKVWDVKDYKLMTGVQVPEGIHVVAFSPDSSKIVSGGSPGLKQQAGGKLESWSPEQFKGVVRIWKFTP